MRNLCLPSVRLAAALGLLAAALGAPPTAHAQVDDHTRWVFAEGVYDQNGFFRQEILVTNPGNQPVHTALSLLTPVARCDIGNLPKVALTGIPARSQYRYVIDFAFVTHFCGNLPASSGVTVVVHSNAPVVAERALYWGGSQRRGLAAEVGFSGPGATTWYFAEGAANVAFDTFFAVANLENQAAEVEVTYFRETGGPRTDRVTVPAGGRQTVHAPANLGGFGAQITSTNGVPIYAERAMYWAGFRGGHVAKGIAAPAREWHMAEAANFDGFFTTFVNLANPNAQAITVAIRYLTDSGTQTVDYAVPARGRRTVLVGPHGGPTNASFSMVATADSPFLAEQSVYVGNMTEGSTTAGVPATARRWAFADGAFGTVDGHDYDTFYAVANPGSSAANVTAHFYRQDGHGAVETYNVPANGRLLIPVTNPDLRNQRFGAVFHSSERVVVARAMYNSRGASAATGVRWSGRPMAAPPKPPEPPPPPPVQPCNIAAVEADFWQLVQGRAPHQTVLINHVYPTLRAKYGASCIVLGASFGGTIEDLWVGGMWVDVLFNNTTHGARHWWWHPHDWDPDLRHPFTP